MFNFSMHWCSGDPYEESINLSNVLGLKYYDKSSRWAEAYPKSEEQQEIRQKLQRTTGEQLSQGIFIGKIAEALEKLAARAQNKSVLLTVIFQAGMLDIIPWELLGEPNNTYIKKHQFLSVSVSRGVTHNNPKIPKAKEKVLISYITSQPLAFPAIHSEAEKDVIEKNISNYGKAKLITYPKSDITHKRFHTFLRDRNPHVLHMALHGEKGKLFFSRESDDQPIPFSTLIKDILEIKSVGLAIFNVCSSSAPQDDDVYSPGLSRQLVELGMPCSIGMAAKITDRAVLEFTEWLYISFGENKTIRIAFSRAVEELRNYNKFDNILWSVPMLYLNQDVMPFVDFLEQILVEPEAPEVDINFFSSVIVACDKCATVCRSIYPSEAWDRIDWESETSELRSSLEKVQRLIDDLEINIPKTNHLPSRDLFSRILRAKRELVTSLTGMVGLLKKQYSSESVKQFAMQSPEVLQKLLRFRNETSSLL